MSLVKVTYTDDETIIHADNLNGIQDEIIDNCVTGTVKDFVIDKKNAARTTIGIPAVSNSSTVALADLTGTVVGTF